MMVAEGKLVSIVAPFYNEADSVDLFHASVCSVVDSIKGLNFEFVCVDDGSQDLTLKELLALIDLDPRVRVLELSRNFGKEAALSAGLDFARGDAVIPIDADLQDPPELIPALLAEWKKGAEVVLARRSDRRSDSFFRRSGAAMFYRVHNHVSQVQIPQNVGDFRLLDRIALDALKQLPERQRFMKGLFAWVGFKTAIVDYKRNSRISGESRFSAWQLWNLALEGITSFSAAPLRLCAYAGGATAMVAILYAAFITFRTLIHGIDVPGYASLLVAILFLGGLQLMSIGLLGEYVGRIYMETKQRPRYIVRRLHESRHEC